jgi:hypothetical protein
MGLLITQFTFKSFTVCWYIIWSYFFSWILWRFMHLPYVNFESFFIFCLIITMLTIEPAVFSDKCLKRNSKLSLPSFYSRGWTDIHHTLWIKWTLVHWFLPLEAFKWKGLASTNRFTLDQSFSENYFLISPNIWRAVKALYCFFFFNRKKGRKKKTDTNL